MVDTGATYTVVPVSVLRGLGVEPRETIELSLADGTVIERDLGQTWARIDGKDVITIVIFGDDDAEPLLGAYTLEGVRLAPDPVNERLVPTRALLLRQSAPGAGE